MSFFSSFFVSLALCSTARYTFGYPVLSFDLASGTLIDLTHPLNKDTVYWPDAGPAAFQFVLKPVTEIATPFFFRTKTFESREHGGTHLDAPSHFAKDGKTIGQLDPSYLMGPLVVLNISAQAQANPDYTVSMDDVTNWEKEHGQIPEGSFVFMFSDWPRTRYPNKAKTFGTKDVTNMFAFHFPGFAGNVTNFLVTERNIRGTGVDTPSTDHGQTKDFGAHRALADNDRVGLENVANMWKMPAAGGFIMAMPMKSEGGTGAPVRIIGIKPSDAASATAASSDQNSAE